MQNETRPDDLLTKRIAELESQLAAARRDSERLEWLFDILALTDNDGDMKAMSLANQVMRKCAGLVDSPRAAIDAARGAK